MNQYLTNHATGHAGEANGLGVEKRDWINSLFGQLTKGQRDVNPFLQDLSEKRARNMGIVQTRRLDRISRAFSTSAEWRPDYRKVSENYSPGADETPTAPEPANPSPKEPLTPESKTPTIPPLENPPRNDAERSLHVPSVGRGDDFHAAISTAAAAHPFGAAVDVKPREFYSDPANKLFLAEDRGAGAAIKSDGELVSVFRNPGSKANIDQVLQEASSHASKLDAFDIGGRLPQLYARYGFRPVARVAFSKDFAPENWDYKKMGSPENVLMVKDPSDQLGLPGAGDYNANRHLVPLVSYDEAVKMQQAAVDKLAEKKD